MSDDFDPYFKWLAIPPDEQPPNHYRLLGVPLFLDDPDVIEAAADQRMMLLRSYQGGSRATLSQKLLNEVSNAKVCLLNAMRKADYDAQLRGDAGNDFPVVEEITEDSSSAYTTESQPPRARSGFSAVAERYAWLGIPPEDWPPSDHQLLGLHPDVFDRDAVEAAVKARWKQLAPYIEATDSRVASIAESVMEEIKRAALNVRSAGSPFFEPEEQAVEAVPETLVPNPTFGPAMDTNGAFAIETDGLVPQIEVRDRSSTKNLARRPAKRSPTKNLLITFGASAVSLILLVLIIASMSNSSSQSPLPTDERSRERLIEADRQFEQPARTSADGAKPTPGDLAWLQIVRTPRYCLNVVDGMPVLGGIGDVDPLLVHQLTDQEILFENRNTPGSFLTYLPNGELLFRNSNDRETRFKIVPVDLTTYVNSFRLRSSVDPDAFLVVEDGRFAIRGYEGIKSDKFAGVFTLKRYYETPQFVRRWEGDNDTIMLTTLTPLYAKVGWHRYGVNSSHGVSSEPVFEGKKYDNYLFMHANAEAIFELPENAVAFRSVLYLGANGHSGVIYRIYADHQQILDSGVIQGHEGKKVWAAIPLGTNFLRIVVDANGDGWADHSFLLEPSLEVAARHAANVVGTRSN